MRGKFLLPILLATALWLTGCASDNAQTAEPTPTVAASESPSPSVEPSPAASPAAEADVFKTVGEEATITVGTTKLNEGAYYTGEGEDTMSFPLLEIAKALGWAATEPGSTGVVEVRLTRDGMDDIIVSYTRPKEGMDAKLPDAAVTKGGQSVDLPADALAFINGRVYANEAMIDKVLQDIEVRYDGAKAITIETKA